MLPPGKEPMATAATVPAAGAGTESGQPSTVAGQATGTTAPATVDKGAATATSTTVAPSVPGMEGLDEEFKNLPPEQQAALKKILTPKFQRAAELAKTAEEKAAALGHLSSLVDAAKAGRSREVIQALAAASGIKVNFDAAAAAAPADTPIGKLQSKMAELFGDDAASQLAPLINEAVTSAVRPAQEVAQKTAAEAAVNGYFAAHPEAQKYRAEVEKLSAVVLPSPTANLSVEQWLGHLVTLASAQDREAEGARKALESIHASAQGGNGGTPRAAVGDTQVVTSAADEGKSFTQILKETAKELAAKARG